MTNDFFIPTGSPLCRVCGDPTDGTASLPTDDGGRVHRACQAPAPGDIAAARKEFATARAMARHLRLGHYQGRNNGGDFSRNIATADALTRAMPKNLAGLLWAEHRLALRISENRDMGNDRPELRARLAGYRREIRSLTPAA